MVQPDTSNQLPPPLSQMPRLSRDEVLERTEAEIVWPASDEPHTFIPLHQYRSVEMLFAAIDKALRSLPAPLRDNIVLAARVVHENPITGSKAMNLRIDRNDESGIATYSALLKRLRRMGADAHPELQVLVEWR